MLAETRLPCIEATGEILLDAGEGLLERVLHVVFVREASDGGNLVEGEAELAFEETDIATSSMSDGRIWCKRLTSVETSVREHVEGALRLPGSLKDGRPDILRASPPR